jgi:multisubunit Na+/H+ antiporter MnhB subunit
MLIEGKIARRKLAYLWLIFGGLLFAIFMGQVLLGKFEDKVLDAWLWVSSNLLPTLSLVSAGYILDQKKIIKGQIERSYYRFSLIISFFYLSSLLFIVLSSPFSAQSILKYYNDSNVFLIPLQGIVSAVIGVFFIKDNGGQ